MFYETRLYHLQSSKKLCSHYVQIDNSDLSFLFICILDL